MWAGLADLTISMSLDYNELPWLGTGDLSALTSLGYMCTFVHVCS